MKKTIIKTSLIVICLILALFLLLPFLDSSPKTETVQRAKPQIFTSNPLTALVKRMASLFSRKEKPSQAISPLSEAQVEEQFGKPLFASLPSEKNEDSFSPAGQPLSVSPNNSETLQLSTDENEWVLVPQTYPELSAQGMHEINIKDNPYDRYVREQKHNETAPLAQKPELPTKTAEKQSAWNKVVSPIKHFLGIEEPTPVGSSTINSASKQGEAFQLASARNNNKYNNQPSSQRYPSLPNMAMNTERYNLAEEDDAYRLRETQRLYSMIYPEQSLRDAAEVWAEGKYPNPDQADQRQRARAQKMQELKSAWENFTREQMLQIKESESDRDDIADILGGCSFSSLPKQACNPGSSEQPATADEIQHEQQINANLFYQITKMQLPNAPITPVLGKAQRPEDTEGLTDEAELTPEQQKIQTSLQIATWLYDQNKCDEDSCFWVANSTQVSPALSDSVKNAGGIFVGDPENWYSSQEEAYILSRTQNVPEDKIEEERAKAKKDFKEAAPAFIVYNTQQMQTAYHHLLSTIDKSDQSDKASFFYVTDPHDALETAEALGGYGILYARQAIKEESVSEGRQLAEDTAVNMANISQKTAELFQETMSEGMRDKLNQNITQFNEAVAAHNGDTTAAFNEVTQHARSYGDIPPSATADIAGTAQEAVKKQEEEFHQRARERLSNLKVEINR